MATDNDDQVTTDLIEFDRELTPEEQRDEQTRARGLEDRDMRRAAASSGKGSLPAPVDVRPYREVMRPGALSAGPTLSEKQTPFHPSPAIHEGRVQALAEFETCGEHLQTALNFLSNARVTLEQVDQAHTDLLK